MLPILASSSHVDFSLCCTLRSIPCMKWYCWLSFQLVSVNYLEWIINFVEPQQRLSASCVCLQNWILTRWCCCWVQVSLLYMSLVHFCASCNCSLTSSIYSMEVSQETILLGYGRIWKDCGTCCRFKESRLNVSSSTYKLSSLERELQSYFPNSEALTVAPDFICHMSTFCFETYCCRHGIITQFISFSTLWRLWCW